MRNHLNIKRKKGLSVQHKQLFDLVEEMRSEYGPPLMTGEKGRTDYWKKILSEWNRRFVNVKNWQTLADRYAGIQRSLKEKYPGLY